MGCPGSKQETYRENQVKGKQTRGNAVVQQPEKRLKQKETSKEDYIKMFEEEKAKNVKLKTRLKQKETSDEDYIKMLEEEKAKNVKLETRLKQNETSKEGYIKTFEEEKAKNVKLKTRIAKGQKLLQDSYDERDKLRKQLKQTETSKEDYIKMLEEEKANEKLEIRELQLSSDELSDVKEEKTRLSAMDGAEMTDNDPNITYLSDANRPTKIAEKYSELYNNAWTDAFSQLTEKDMKSEKEAIHILLEIFLNIYKECMALADRQLETLTKAVTSFGTVDEDLSEIMKPLKDKRKKQYAIQVKQLEPIVDQLLKTTSLATTDSSQIKPFLEESLELCSLMVIQDPLVYVDCEINIKGQAFDKNMFKGYTSSGKTIDFIVWPALFIQDRGALLCKGVAQGQNNKHV